ncbi:MAG TPA: hypothetical protein VGI64_00615 [Streptosporangiaceae bacterium]
MTITDGGEAGPISQVREGGKRRRLPRRIRWGLGGLGIIAIAGLITIAIAAKHYQPLSYGSSENDAELYPGMPSGQGIRLVNTVGNLHEDFYIPPQRGAFSLFVDVSNNGSYPVTIEAVTVPASGLRLAGPVRYSVPGMGGSDIIPPPQSRLLHDFVLRPGGEMFIGLLVRTSPCASRDSWQSLPSFKVQMRFLGFTRSVALPWGMQGDSLIMHQPAGGPGDPGTVCLPDTIPPEAPGGS